GEMLQNIDIQSIHTQNEKSIINQLESSLLSETGNDVERPLSIEILHSELVVLDRSFPERSGNYCLAYHIHLSIPSLEEHREYMVHAVSGEVLFTQDLVCNYFPKGTAPSYHY